MGLLHLLIFLSFGKWQDFVENSSAWQWALSFAGITLLFGLFDGNLIAAVISAVIWGLYSWAYFGLLRRVTDSLILWLMVWIGGAILPWLLLMKLVLGSGAQ